MKTVRPAMPDLLGSLNAPQREAVLHGRGPLLVLAGAGSGKTRVIMHRMAHLMQQGVLPERLLGVTFTNKAARQMRQRLSALAGRGSGKVNLCTFHSLGLLIIKEAPEAAGVRPGFCIYDTSDQLSLIRDLLRQVKVADRRLDNGRILELILSTKKKKLAEVALRWGDDYEMAAFDLYPRYVAQMRAYNALDFDDLILRSQQALADPQVGKHWAQRFDYVMVDEYQDTSADQLALLQALCRLQQNICAVGDDDQAIYGWRGAVADNILGFGKTFAAAREVILAQNYRSTGNILRAANAIIAKNTARKGKSLFTADADGEPVHLVACGDEEDEALFVCETLHKRHACGVPYRDMAVLYRSNVQSRAFEEVLRLEGVPYQVIGGQAFFDRKEVRDAMAYLAVLHNPGDEVALRRIVNVPPRGIGAQSLERLEAAAAAQGSSLWEAVCRAEEVPGLGRAARQGAASLAQLLGEVGPRLKAASRGQAAAQAGELFARLQLKE
ncbi:MAG: DNA helicase UvrD, partial [Deltaproteobacteria bacterium]